MKFMLILGQVRLSKGLLCPAGPGKYEDKAQQGQSLRSG